MALRAVADGVFAEVGPGAPVVLALHGWGRSRADWLGVLPAEGLVAVDLPGFGSSPVPAQAWGAHEYGVALAPVLDLFEVPPVVVGHSFGGRVTVAMAADGAPVKGLVLAGVPLLRRSSPTPRGPFAYRFTRWAHRVGLVGDDRLEGARRRYGSADYRAAQGVLRDILVRAVNESYRDELARLGVPVRLVWGADDTAAPVEMAEEALGILQAAGVDASLDVHPGVGHDIHRHRPEAIRAAVGSLT